MNKVLKTFLIIVGVIMSLGLYATVSTIFETNLSNTSEVKADTAEMKTEFMKGCNAMEGVDLTDYCDCTWNYLLDDTTDAEFNALIIDYANEPVSSQSEGLMNKAVDSCASKL